MILNEIRAKLEELDDNVFYGAFDKSRIQDALWNYTVFNRAPTSVSKDRTSYTDYFDIHIVRENYVPEGTDKEYIDKLLEIPGVRLAENNLEYDYARKGNTNTVVEMLTIRILKARK